MSHCTVRPADRLFRRRCLVAACLFLVLYLVCSQLSLYVGRGPAGLALAGLAGACFFGELVAVAFLVVRIRDEFQRVLLTQSFVWASVLTTLLATVWGFMELHDHEHLPHIPVLVLPFLLILLTAAAKLVIFRQHKSPAE
jgi:hypothetical protein